MRFFTNLKIGKKIALLIAFTFVALTSIAIAGYYGMNQIANTSKVMYQNRLLPVQWLNQFRANLYVTDSYVLEIILSNDHAYQTELKQNILKKRQENEQFLQQYQKTVQDPHEQDLARKLHDELNLYQQKQDSAMEYGLNNNTQIAYEDYVVHVIPYRQQLFPLIDELVNYNTHMAQELNTQNNKHVNTLNLNTLLIDVIVTLICVGIGYQITRSITRPIQAMQAWMARAESGDLTVKGDYVSKDEIGTLTQSFNSMLEGIQNLIQQIRDSASGLAKTSKELHASAEQTRLATHQISNSVLEIATGAESQSQSIGETWQTVEHMSQNVQQILTSSQDMTKTAVRASHTAESGNQSVQTAIQQMNLIHDAVEKSSQAIQDLNEQALNIGKIVEVISEIASQTNLLALNAAIEAARAGEHGRGFIVVADEVRRLAEESSVSAKRIADYIYTIKGSIVSVVETMTQGAKEVKAGIQVVYGVGESFEQIKQAIYDVTTQIQTVSQSVTELAAGSEQILNAMDQISRAAITAVSITQTVSASTQEQIAFMEAITNSANALSGLAEELQQLVGSFQV
jgi:methyl-accepting chemotaxis protein